MYSSFGHVQRTFLSDLVANRGRLEQFMNGMYLGAMVLWLTELPGIK